jgi:hypothetical protein
MRNKPSENMESCEASLSAFAVSAAAILGNLADTIR